MPSFVSCLIASAMAFFLAAVSGHPPSPPAHGMLVVANQYEHTALIVDPESHQELAKLTVGINGHEVAISPDSRLAYVPIYGNSGVGKPGTDGTSIDVIDLQSRRLAATIALGKPLRPHRAAFGPDGLLYVTVELDHAVDVIDPATRKVIAQIPTGAIESHMIAISPDGRRAYTANVGAGSVSVLDLVNRKLVTVIPIAKTVQRICVSRDGKYVFTHDQGNPRIAVIDASTNKIAKWIAVPATVYSSSPTLDDRKLLAASPSGKIFVIDLASSSVERAFDIPPSNGELLLSPDGNSVFVSCPQAGVIEVLDLAQNKLQEPIKLTKGVDGLAWAAVP
ncbi:MAG TPA: cytochrome D1 domain-containing protein [Candidatus Methylomirabilis sp.]|nr:cytochrome D1 domain-containing protein [Candidatus Methylomirabilis sp.]